MLRTFDELGYRQEQRFHFELGLLKLVHLRRLLPVEEVLSQLPVASSSGPPKPQSAAAQARVAAPNPVANRVMSAAAPISAKPAFSPFQADTSRKQVAEPVPVKTPEPASAVAAPQENEAPAPVAATVVEAPAAKQETASASHDPAELQRIATDALMAAKSQSSAADALADAEWTIDGFDLRVQTELSTTMLPMVINPEAEKIVRAALRDAGAGALKLLLLPGAANSAAAKKPRAARSGSVQAKAMEHPIVQQAQKLFDAEIRNVIDLREGD